MAWKRKGRFPPKPLLDLPLNRLHNAFQLPFIRTVSDGASSPAPHRPCMPNRDRMTSRWLRFAAVAAASLALLARPAAAQQILRDAETEALLAALSAPSAQAAGLGPLNPTGL